MCEIARKRWGFDEPDSAFLITFSMHKLDPRNVSFGAVAAEMDVHQGLFEYFLETESFRRLRDGRKTVALGNRGSGKSAIFKMIAEHARAEGKIVLELAPEDYSYEILSHHMVPEDRGNWVKQGAYTAAWKYMIYVESMKAIAKHSKGFKKGASARIYAFVRDNLKDRETNPIGILISFLKRLESFKIGEIGIGFKARQLQALYQLEDIASYIKDIEEVTEKTPIIVLVDELDKGWDGSEDAKAFVAGLFQAAARINANHAHLKVMLSLRRELYYSIPSLYEDAQKVRDSIETITWDEAQLKELIGRRIANSVPQLKGKTTDECWNSVFSESLEYRNARSFNYMIDRTLYRPREILQFCIDVVDSVAKRGEWLPANYPAISSAEQHYSTARLQDIASEYRFQYPGLESVFETFRGHQHSFDRETLELHCLKIGLGEIGVSDEAKRWCHGIEADQLIQVLWEIGFIQAHTVGGVKAQTRSGSRYLGSHQIQSLSLINIGRFQIHPMFRSCLGTKEPKSRRT